MDQSHADWVQTMHDGLGITLDAVAPAVEATLGDARGIDQAFQVYGGQHSVVFEVPRPDGSIMLRAQVGAPDVYEGERWARTQCRAVGVPAMPILGVWRSRRGEQTLSVCVEEKSAGRPLLDVLAELGPHHPRSATLVREVGLLMSRMHSVTPEGYGQLDGEGRGPDASYADHVLLAAQMSVARVARRGADDTLLQRAYAALAQNAGLLDGPGPSLLQMDCGPNHWYVERDQVVGLIDLEAACGADPAWDLMWWDYWFDWGTPGPVTSVLLEGYENHPALRLDTLAQRIALLRIATGISQVDGGLGHGRTSEAVRAASMLEADIARFSSTTSHASREGGGRREPSTARVRPSGQQGLVR